jgi:cytochrome P450
VDFFSDPELIADPYPYYEHLREQCPVTYLPRSGVAAVTGYEELTQAYRDGATFSASTHRWGPFRCRSR